MSPLPCLPLSFTALQTLDERDFVKLLGPVVEHAAWVAADSWKVGPFDNWEMLFQAMAHTVLHADATRQLALLRGHPELAGEQAQAGTMTLASESEQGRLGLHCLKPEFFQRLAALNQHYQARFGFPFILALRLQDSLDSVLTEFEARLCNDTETERSLALAQVIQVMRGRLEKTVLPEAISAPRVLSASQLTLIQKAPHD